jgi:hypothetical protein
MGKPAQVNPEHPMLNPVVGIGGAPGELKHLSNPRKREHSLSSGERKGNSPNPHCVKPVSVAMRGL